MTQSGSGPEQTDQQAESLSAGRLVDDMTDAVRGFLEGERVDEAVQASVQGTPTVFVNGRRLETSRLPPGTSRYSALVRDIRALLRAAL